MENIGINTVVIDAHHYEDLVRAATEYEMLLNMLARNIRLSYEGTYLRIDDEAVIDILNLFDDSLVIQRERALRKEWEEKHKEEEE